MKSERVVFWEKGGVSQNGGFLRQGLLGALADNVWLSEIQMCDSLTLIRRAMAMDSILKAIEALQRTSIPNLLIILGGVFLLLAFVGRIGATIELPGTATVNRGYAASATA